MLASLKRLGVIFLGYAVGSLAAGFVLGAFLSFARANSELDPLSGGLGGAVLFWVFVMFITIQPTLFAVAIAEAFAFRNLSYYVVAGIVTAVWILFAGDTQAIWASLSDPDSFARQVAPALIISGAIAGMVYWWIAGRAAGDAGSLPVPWARRKTQKLQKSKAD